MSDDFAKILQKLRILWKSTLYTIIYILYTALIGWLFVCIDWRAALLAFITITVTHPLRYIVNSVDKIGWEIDTKPHPVEVKNYQRRLYWGLYAVIIACNFFLIGQAYYVGNLWAILGVFVGCSITEFLFGQIQSLNKKIQFTGADYDKVL